MVAEPIRAVDCYYSPERISGWLRRWDELLTLSESLRSSRHLQTTECKPGHSCSYGSPVGIRDVKGHHHDQLKYADILADLERAHARLRFHSLPWSCVDLRMRRAGKRHPADTLDGPDESSNDLHDIARALGIRYGVVRDAYAEALKTMAEFLGWEE